MFKHEKMLFHPVAVEKPNPQYAALLQEQLGDCFSDAACRACYQYFHLRLSFCCLLIFSIS